MIRVPFRLSICKHVNGLSHTDWFLIPFRSRIFSFPYSRLSHLSPWSRVHVDKLNVARGLVAVVAEMRRPIGTVFSLLGPMVGMAFLLPP